MAFGLIYFAEETCLGSVIRAEIYEKDYAGASTELQFMDEGCLVMPDGPGARDVYQSITATTAEVRLWDRSGVLATTMDSVSDRSHQLIIKRDGSIFFKGWVRPEPLQQTLSSFPETIVLQAQCGLADLKNLPFVDSNGDQWTGYMSLRQILIEVLKTLALGLDVYIADNWWAPDLGGTNGDFVCPLEYMRVHVERTYTTEDGLPVSCEDVLADLCIGRIANIRQSDGAWHFVQREEKFAGTYYRHQYDMAHTLLAHGAYDPGVSATEAQMLSWSLRSSLKMLGYQATQIQHNHGEIPVLIDNPDFSGRLSNIRRRREGYDPAGRFARNQRNRWGFGDRVPVDDEPLSYAWKWDDGGNVIKSDIIEGVGPNGENVVKLPRKVNGLSQLVTTPSEVYDLVKDTYIYNVGRTVLGGDNRGINVQLMLFLDVDGQQESPSHTYPFLYAVRIENIETLEQKWLTDVEDGNGFNFWVPGPWYITMRQKWEPQGQGPHAIGAYAEAWQYSVHTSVPIPDGAWQVTVFVYPPYDWKHDVWDDKWELKAQQAAYVTNVFLNLFDDNGLIRKSATVVTAHDAASEQTVLFQRDTRIGDGYIVDGVGALTYDKADLGSAWNGTGNWKKGRYTVEPPTGVSMAEMAARALWRMQSAPVPTQQAEDPIPISEFFAHPHQVPRIDGVSYDIGEATYNLLRGVWEPRLIQISQEPDAGVVNAIDDTRTGAFGPTSNAAAVLAAISNATGAFLNRDYIAKTTAVIPAGLATQLQVEMRDGATLSSGDLVILLDRDARDYQFTVTENADETTLILKIDDDSRQGNGFDFTSVVDYPAFLFVRQGYLRTLVALTDDAFRVSVSGNVVAILDEDIPATVLRDSLVVRPLRIPVKRGRPLIVSADPPIYVTVRTDADTNATVLEIEEEYIEAGDGTEIVLDAASMMGELLVQAHQVRLAVEEIRKKHAICQLSADVTGSTDTLLVTATTGYILDNAALVIVHPTGEKQQIVTADIGPTPLAPGATSITIDTFNFGAEGFPADSVIEIAGYHIGTEVKLTNDEVNVRAYEDDVIQTFFEERGGVMVLVDQVSTNTRLYVDNLPEAVPGGATIECFYNIYPGSGPGAKGKFAQYFSRTVVGGGAPAGQGYIDVTSALPASIPIGSKVYYKFGEVLTRIVDNEASIVVNANSITNQVTSLQKEAVGTLGGNYSVISRTSLTLNVDSGSPYIGTVFAIGDKFVLQRISTGDIYRAEVSAPWTVVSGSNVVSIYSTVIGGDTGDPFRVGAMAQTRLDTEGFILTVEKMATSNWDAPVNGLGEVTGHANVGFGFTYAGYAAIGGDLWVNGRVYLGSGSEFADSFTDPRLRIDTLYGYFRVREESVSPGTQGAFVMASGAGTERGRLQASSYLAGNRVELKSSGTYNIDIDSAQKVVLDGATGVDLYPNGVTVNINENSMLRVDGGFIILDGKTVGPSLSAGDGAFGFLSGIPYAFYGVTSYDLTAGATPAGSTSQIQYNNAGAFGASSDLTITFGSDTIVKLNGHLDSKEDSTPGTPASGFSRWYNSASSFGIVKSNGDVWRVPHNLANPVTHGQTGNINYADYPLNAKLWIGGTEYNVPCVAA